MSRAYTFRSIASVILLPILSTLALAHDTEHHATTDEILDITNQVLEEIQELRDDFDAAHGPAADDDSDADSGNDTGAGDVTGCVAMWWEGSYLHYRNQCSYTVSIAYCDLNPRWSWEESCGENRNARQPFYTDIKHLCPGDENKWYNPGEINWAACKGFINVRDSRGEFTSDSNGDYSCHNNPNGYDPCR